MMAMGLSMSALRNVSPSSVLLRGVATRDGPGAIAIPPGAIAGDTLVLVCGGVSAAPTNPTGFTSRFATAASGTGSHFRRVSVKAMASGETSVTATGTAGYEQYLLVFAGSRTVATANQYTQPASGAVGTYTVASTAKNVVLVASDDGATTLPTISTAGLTSSGEAKAASFWSRWGYYAARAVGQTVTFTDAADGSLSTGLFFTVS